MSSGDDIIASDVSNIADLNDAIKTADGEAAGSGPYEIDLSSSAIIYLSTALEAINLKTGVSLY